MSKQKEAASKKLTKKKTNKKKTTKKKTTAKKKTAKKKTAKKAETKKKTAKKRNYLNNRDLLAEVITSKECGQMTDKLALMLQTLCARYGRKGNYVGYSYNEDMQAFAMMELVRTWNSFNPEKSQNPFAFFTQCIKHSFIQYLNRERKQRDIRDEMLVKNGLTPSHTFQMQHEESQKKLHEEREAENATVESTQVGEDDILKY